MSLSPSLPVSADASAEPPASADASALYTVTYDKFMLLVLPRVVRSGEEALRRDLCRQIAHYVEGKCGRNGYVRPGSVAFVDRSAPRAVHSGFLEISVDVQYDCFHPLVNARLARCVCTSNNNAAVIGEVRDAQGHLCAFVHLPREGVVADANANDMSLAAELAPAADLLALQPGDTFRCLVRLCSYALYDEHLTIYGQLLRNDDDTGAAADPDDDIASAAAAAAARDDPAAADDGRAAVQFWAQFEPLRLEHRVNLRALRDELVRESVTVVPTSSSAAAAAAAARATPARACEAVPLLLEMVAADDRTAHLTLAVQEAPLLHTVLTRRARASGERRRLPSFFQAWDRTPALRDLFARTAAALRAGTAGPAPLDRRGRPVFDALLELRWQHRRDFHYDLATTFMPAYAKAIVRHFGARRVLDPCGGWGDRLAGALALREATDGALAQRYVCFDPNRAVHPGYRRLATLFDLRPTDAAAAAADDCPGQHFGGRTDRDPVVSCYACPFEEGAPRLLADASFDLVFTSPPFFDLETYAADNPRYDNDWLGGFYRPLMRESARCVAPGGHVCIHIDDTSAGDITRFLCEEVPARVAPALRLLGRLALRGVLSNEPRSVWVYVKEEA